MKRLLPLIVFLFPSFAAGAREDGSPRRYLELQGRIYRTGFDARGTERYFDSARIVVKNLVTREADTLFSAESGDYLFRLPLNNEFMITVSGDSFLPKQLYVNTHVPLFTTGYYGLQFELSLFREIPGVKIALLDEPVANIAFNKEKKRFDYNRAYTEQVNRELKKIYTAYYLHRPIPATGLKKPVKLPKHAKKKIRKGKNVRISGK